VENIFMKKKKKNIFRNLIIVLVFIGILFLLNLYQKEIKSFSYNLFLPIQKVFWKIGDSASDFFNVFIKIKNAAEEINKLKSENKKLLYEISDLKEVKKQNEFLRKALNIGLNKDFDILFANIVAKDINSDSILIDKGEVDGVLKDMPVLTEEKILVGKVEEVYKNSSKIMLISNKKSEIDVKIQKEENNNDIFGILKGEGNFKIILDLIPNEKEVFKDDKIITTSLGGIFPPNILIGKIKEVKKSDVSSFQYIEVDPYFDIKDIESLFVVKNILNH